MLAICSAIPGYAQQKSADSAANKQKVKELFFNAGLQYLSNLTYAGRKDESSVPVLLPTFTIITRQGFFVSAIGYFDLNGSKSSAEGLSVTPGYVFSFDSKKYYGGNVSATKYFITNDSPIILSSFNATVDGQLYVNPCEILKLTVGASYRFGKQSKNDIINSAELSKEITVAKTGVNKTDGLKLTPTATLYVGTQSFYQTYYTNSVVQRAVETPGSSGGLFDTLFPNQPKQTIINETVTQQHQQEVRKYDLLAFSAALPVTYGISKWQLLFTPYFIKPFNQVDYVSNMPKNRVYFLFMTGVSVTF